MSTGLFALFRTPSSHLTRYYRDADFEDRPQPQGQHVARMADITLASANDVQLDFDDPGYGFDLDGGIGSQDYDLDLGIDFGDGPTAGDAERTRTEDETMSVEVGRDAAPPRSARESLDSHLLRRDGADLDVLSVRSREMSEHPFGADVDMDFGPDLGPMDIDLGLDFGDGVPPEERAKSKSRGCESLVLLALRHGVLILPT